MKRPNLWVWVGAGCGCLGAILGGLFMLFIVGMQAQQNALTGEFSVDSFSEEIDMQMRVDRLGVPGLKVAVVRHHDSDRAGTCADLSLPTGMTPADARTRIRKKFKANPASEAFEIGKGEFFIVVPKGKGLEACVATSAKDVAAVRSDSLRSSHLAFLRS
ncbi:MAG: hypothetical protein ACO1SV_16600 [Fimbriimonas sp.]